MMNEAVIPLIRRLEQARERIEAVRAEIGPHEEIYPDWTVKHVLAHIAAWDDVSHEAIRAHLEGAQAATHLVESVTAFNARAVADSEPFNYEDAVSHFQKARGALKALLRRIPTAKLEETLVFPWGRRGTIPQLIEGLARHEVEHAEEMEGFC